MTVSVRSPRFADAREAADLAAFLGRLLHYDRAAAVRLQAGGGALAVFGRPPSFEVLAIRTARLSETHEFDVTVSAGELLESLDTEVDRSRDAALPEDRRTREERDLIGRDIWSRTVGDTELPLRAVHAAQSLGFLRPAPDLPVALLTAGAWLRLRTPFGSIALRGTGSGLGTLAVTVGTV